MTEHSLESLQQQQQQQQQHAINVYAAVCHGEENKINQIIIIIKKNYKERKLKHAMYECVREN
jgi:hypothetical protein